jgi:DNA-binding transcriptional MerR regulator
MKMRDLEAQTGLSRETIRVYLRHGLLPQPHRSGRNVADYDERHVLAIRAVRGLQRDSGLTLRQIKDVLKGRHQDRRIQASAFHDLEALVTTRVGIDDRQVPLKSLLKAFPRAEEDARVLQSIGIVDIIQTSTGPALSVTDTRLVSIWGEMRTVGFTEALGFTPEVLAFYVEPSEYVASKEAAIFLEHTEGKISSEQAAEMLQSALRVMLDFFGLMRMKAFLRHIHHAGSTLPAPAQARSRGHKGKRSAK